MKKITAALLALTLLLCAAIPAYAAGGTWDGVQWNINGGVLTVSGGDVPSASTSYQAPWHKFAPNVTKIVIGDGVASVGERAFDGMYAVQTVDIGGVTSVGAYAFSDCSSLTSVTLPAVTSIGSYAFAECTSLKTVTLAPTLAYVGECPWEACTALTSFTAFAGDSFSASDGVLLGDGSIVRFPPAKTGAYTVPGGIAKIARGAFRDCLLESVDLGAVTEIADGAFAYSKNLAGVTLASVQNIGASAFYGCTSLRDIDFSENLVSIGNRAFADCGMLGTVTFRGTSPAMGEGVFDRAGQSFTVMFPSDAEGFTSPLWLGYPALASGNVGGTEDGYSWVLDTDTGLLTVTGEGEIPDFAAPSDAPWYTYRRAVREIRAEDGITSVGNNAFTFTSASYAVLPDTVVRIGDSAFAGCALLETVRADGVTDVGVTAFYGDASLGAVSLVSVERIGKQAFSECSALKYLMTGKAAPETGEYAFDFCDSVTLLYPVGATGYDGTLPPSEQYVPGDSNGDGKCNVSDVVNLLKYIANWGVEIKFVASDANPDGKINLSDVTAILKKIAGYGNDICLEGLIK